MKLYRSQKAELGILETYDALLSGWGTALTETDVETRYGLTHVIAAGREDAPPVVLFHGVGDDAALMWIYNAKALAEHFRIYAVDTLGGPGKSRPDDRYDKDFQDELWMDDVLDALAIQQASLIGVSHGGYLVQLYSLLRKERVDKAIAIASSVPSGEGSGSPMKTMMKIFLPEALFPTEKNVAKLIRKLSGENADVFLANPAVMAHYRWLLKGFNNMAMAYHKVRTFTDSEIDQIKPRVLYLVGEDDPFQKLGGNEALLSRKMNAVVYPNAGHGLNHELAEKINQRMIAHLLERES